MAKSKLSGLLPHINYSPAVAEGNFLACNTLVRYWPDSAARHRPRAIPQLTFVLPLSPPDMIMSLRSVRER